MEIGIFSFGDTYPDPETGVRLTARESLRDLLERIRLADTLGLDYYGVGEHHRTDFSVSACSTVLSAAAAVTERIRLGTATTVLTTDDPIRLYEQFSTLDVLSDGRAEIGLGSGGFLEPYALFDVDYDARHAVFAEKIERFAAIDAAEDGDTNAIVGGMVWPRPLAGRLRIAQSTGVDAASFARAARLGFGVQTTAPTPRFEELAAHVDDYRTAGAAAGFSADRLRVEYASHAYVGDDRQRAIDDFFPHYRAYVANMRVNQGKPAPTREQYEAAVEDLDSNILVGDAASVIAKIAHQHERLGHDRHLFQIDWRAVPQAAQLRAIEILASDVLPAVRRLTRPVAVAA